MKRKKMDGYGDLGYICIILKKSKKKLKANIF